MTGERGNVAGGGEIGSLLSATLVASLHRIARITQFSQIRQQPARTGLAQKMQSTWAREKASVRR